ncbi:aspartyl-phosphate phosphatase Spo0E family protein [Thermosediminibacter oceani]|uniref:Sporulation stage 0, Spo0E-like regulatory phosphatase n=1 Tax=Thermosediminibacter oceani (strain ATCC BAA-1034 / DSM 16646 / JW/IW-1228P) TaxID=555079 RepID=D9S2S4_THEOJ|nr:aspartyl-phosphate phosphatase Spo0E family protein [Thermosediminibacter oceani]ADL07701.1 Sporulation stage 0, Spo0E-like regulatory phosphatase [Thermosediminibacter oceani DSM 16646]
MSTSTLLNLSTEIGNLKRKLNEKLEKKNLLAHEVYAISIELDKLILAYQRIAFKME